MPVQRLCKDCGRSVIVWSSVQTRCARCQQRRSKAKPRKALPPPTKPIPKVGKQGKRTAAAVAKWKRTQAPDHAGNYECYICRRLVPYLMAEHVKSKARHPDRRTDPTNLRSVCAECNRDKGSNDN